MKKLLVALVLLFAVSLFINCTPESQVQDEQMPDIEIEPNG